MYKSPISISTDMAVSNTTAAEQLKESADNAIYKAICDLQITVDRAELIRALDYDRRQYEQGFRDGYKAVNEQALCLIIRTLERSAGQSAGAKLEILAEIQEIKRKSDAEAYVEGMHLAEKILRWLEEINESNH